MQKIGKITLIVLDSVGIGEAPDSADYGDEGSNTLRNTSYAVGGLNLPNLARLGLGNLGDVLGVPSTKEPAAAIGQLTEKAQGKDTTSGHWELAGVILDEPFPTFPNGFPTHFIKAFEKKINRKVLGNYAESGTTILQKLGQEHIATGNPIVYTSADSVFQIAAHEEIISIEELYSICQTAREMLTGELGVGRVIARPFVGYAGTYKRTENRRDFGLEPPQETILDKLKAAGYWVAGVGKVDDIFAHRGLTASNHTGNNNSGINAIIEFIRAGTSGLIFANLNDFDTLYGHRNDPYGYAKALEEFDKRLPEIEHSLGENDILIITADHGNDPTTPSTDHSRERVPLLATGNPVKPNVNIGTRESFADVAATIAGLLKIDWDGPGSEFTADILKPKYL